jgi:NADH-ubiquinone oxidoreductase chain 4
LSARLRIIFYTLRASIPLLTLLVFSQQFFSIVYIENFFALNRENTRFFSAPLIAFFLLAFAVKLPIFGVHLWLPKAHVEAPVLGSMVLAAILLKLGSYGLWLFFQITFSLSLINI